MIGQPIEASQLDVVDQPIDDSDDVVVPLHNPGADGGLTLVNAAAAVPTRWILDGIIARGAVTMLAGAPKAGKSLLALQWANEAAARYRTVIVDAENGANVIAQRLAELPTVESPWSANPRAYEAMGFDLDASIEQLDRILSSGCDFLVLDSWVSLWTGSENSVPAVKRSLEALRTLARKHDVGILLIHHTTKGSNTYRGSGAIAGAIEAVFTLTRGRQAAERVLTCRAMRIGPEPPEAIYMLHGTRFVRADAASTTPPAPAAAGQQGTGRGQTGLPSVREILKLEERGLITKRKAKELLRGHLGESPRWWWLP